MFFCKSEFVAQLPHDWNKVYGQQRAVYALYISVLVHLHQIRSTDAYYVRWNYRHERLAIECHLCGFDIQQVGKDILYVRVLHRARHVVQLENCLAVLSTNYRANFGWFKTGSEADCMEAPYFCPHLAYTEHGGGEMAEPIEPILSHFEGLEAVAQGIGKFFFQTFFSKMESHCG